MFGYVVLSSEDSSKEEKARYREFYCGLCHVLGEKYGAKGKANLSYDFTFLSILLSDLWDEKRTEGMERCSVHPVKAHRYITTKAMEYASDMQMLLSYHALRDGVKDEGKSERKLSSYRKELEDLREKYPRQCRVTEENLLLLDEEEKHGRKDAEYNALLFGQILGEIFVKDEKDFFAPDLMALGVGLGRYIYLLDAWDDRKDDRKKGRYNPLPDDMDSDRMKELLLDAAASSAAAFERLPLDEYLPILRNIIYRGIWTRYKAEKK